MKATFLILAVAATCSAAPLWNTGVNAAGVPTTGGEIHYTVTGPASTAFIIASNPGWYAVPPGANGTGTANWITADGTSPFNIGELVGAAGLYTYSYTGGFTGSTLTGVWAADNCGTMLVDGVSVSTIGGGATAGCVPTVAAFQTLRAFNLAGLGAGAHTLSFQVFNVGSTPTGLLVDSLSTGGGVPEPSSILLALTGFGLLGLGIRRRQAAK